jgi:ribosomal protein L19
MLLIILAFIIIEVFFALVFRALLEQRNKIIEKEQIQIKGKAKPRAESYYIRTNYKKLGGIGFECKELPGLTQSKGDSGFYLIYTRLFSVFIDLNDFKTADSVIVKDLLIEKYYEFLDAYSQYCLEAKKNVLNEMFNETYMGLGGDEQ